MIGAIVGDVIGSRFEFNNTRDYNFELFTAQNSYTDDTICTLAIADAILSLESFQDKLLEWCRIYPNPMGGYGVSFARWIFSNDHLPYNSFGNGSAMRVSPVAWWYDNLDDVLREAEKSASVTHNHPEGIKGAKAIAHAIWYLIHHKDETEICTERGELFNSRKAVDMQGFASTMNEYYPGFMHHSILPGKFNETCQGTVPVCLKILCESTSFEDAIRRAISWGGDSDTIGAIVGSMAEAAWGVPNGIRNYALNYLDERMIRTIWEFNSKMIFSKTKWYEQK